MARPMPKVLLVDSKQEQEQVTEALVLLSRYPGVLDNSDGHGWLVIPREAGSRVFPFTDRGESP